MKQILVRCLIDAPDELGISKSSYYRWSAEGRITVQNKKREGLIGYLVTLTKEQSMTFEPKPTLIDGHALYIKGWVLWRDFGIGIRPWKETYKKQQLRYVREYFKRYDFISPECLEEWVAEVNILQQSH